MSLNTAPKTSLDTSPEMLLDTALETSLNAVRFLGHDTYSACKHCASGYVLSFFFVHFLTVSLYFSCIAFTIPRVNRQGSLEDMRACIELRRGA